MREELINIIPILIGAIALIILIILVWIFRKKTPDEIIQKGSKAEKDEPSDKDPKEIDSNETKTVSEKSKLIKEPSIKEVSKQAIQVEPVIHSDQEASKEAKEAQLSAKTKKAKFSVPIEVVERALERAKTPKRPKELGLDPDCTTDEIKYLLSKEPFLKKVTKEKIKYQPNDRFLQTTEIKRYPLVNMPVADSDVLFPNHGKIRPKGYVEGIFIQSLLTWFPNHIMSNHHLHFEGVKHDYEPDFIFKCKEYNLFVDIEIDEPYSGRSRKPMHFIGSYDVDRDRYFNVNGWVVIRFAEEQVFRFPKSCGKFISQVVDSLISSKYSEAFLDEPDLKSIKKWTFEEAEIMAIQNYRESYLGIEFNQIDTTQIEEIEAEIENPEIIYDPGYDVKIDWRDTETAHSSKDETEKSELIESAINENLYLLFNYSNGIVHLVNPIKVTKNRSVPILIAYDYVDNLEMEFEIRLISNLETRLSPFLFETKTRSLHDIRKYLDIAMNNGLYIRLEYRDAHLKNTLRSVGFYNYADEFYTKWTDFEYVTGLCFLRKDKRTFKIPRTKYLWVLALSFDHIV